MSVNQRSFDIGNIRAELLMKWGYSDRIPDDIRCSCGHGHLTHYADDGCFANARSRKGKCPCTKDGPDVTFEYYAGIRERFRKEDKERVDAFWAAMKGEKV